MKNYLYSLALCALAFSLTSCDSGDEPAPWEPAEPSNTPGIYFTNTDNLLSITVGDDTHVSIPVCRLVTDGELTVPLVTTAGNPNLIVPESVRFADGEATSQITVDLANIPTKELISLNITFPDEYINPYAAGSAVFEGSVLVSDWESVSSEPVMLQWLDWSYQPSTLFDPIPQDLQHLPGTTRYRFIDFLNSGITFTFEIKPSEYDAWKGYNRMYPLGNQVLYSEYSWAGYYNPWWLVEDDLQVWPELYFASGNQTITLYGASFMWYDDEYQNEYCYMRLANEPDANGNTSDYNFGYMAFYAFYDDSWDWSNFSGYLHLYFSFPEK